jgi:hypothetical protein
MNVKLHEQKEKQFATQKKKKKKKKNKENSFS